MAGVHNERFLHCMVGDSPLLSVCGILSCCVIRAVVNGGKCCDWSVLLLLVLG